MLVAIDDQVSEITQELMEKAVADFEDALGIEAVAIEPDADHDGDPVIFVRTRHRLVKPHIVAARIREMERAVGDVAWDAGERRFVHFRHEFHDRQILHTDR